MLRLTRGGHGSINDGRINTFKQMGSSRESFGELIPDSPGLRQSKFAANNMGKSKFANNVGE